jgi:hypothetical protein
MSNVYLASFKGTKPGWQGWVEHITRFFTKSIYSHSEICVGNPFEGAVLCISSVGTEGGVRGKVMQLDPKDWDVLPLATVYPQQVLNFLEQHRGEPYDLIGCVRSVLPFVGREHPTKYFCSEVCATVIGIQDPWRMHPGVLHMVMTSRNEVAHSGPY